MPVMIVLNALCRGLSLKLYWTVIIIIKALQVNIMLSVINNFSATKTVNNPEICEGKKTLAHYVWLQAK